MNWFETRTDHNAALLYCGLVDNETWTDHNAALLYCGLVDNNNSMLNKEFSIFSTFTIKEQVCRRSACNSLKVNQIEALMTQLKSGEGS